jgi:hypothetical protein
MNCEKFVPNPSYTSTTTMEMYEFVGKLMGMSIRTKLLLPFEFPPLIWKALVGEVVKPVDLSAIDAVTCSFLTALRNCEEDGVTDHESFEAKYNQELDFTYTGSDGVQRPLRTPGLDRSLSTGSPRIVTFENRLEYCAAVERARIHEFDAQVARIADGLGKVVPMDALQLFSWQQLEVLVAGSPTFDIDLWKKNTSSTGVSSRNLAWFWKVIESLSSKDQSAFIRFAWGRSRLPNAKHFSTKMKLSDAGRATLPIAHTCFFSIELPNYESEEAMRRGILTVIEYGVGGILLS